jgi:hypothetical protein
VAIPARGAVTRPLPATGNTGTANPDTDPNRPTTATLARGNTRTGVTGSDTGPTGTRASGTPTDTPDADGADGADGDGDGDGVGVPAADDAAAELPGAPGPDDGNRLGPAVITPGTIPVRLGASVEAGPGEAVEEAGADVTVATAPAVDEAATAGVAPPRVAPTADGVPRPDTTTPAANPDATKRTQRRDTAATLPVTRAPTRTVTKHANSTATKIDSTRVNHDHSPNRYENTKPEPPHH